MSDAPIAYEEDGVYVLRASALGGCTKAMAAVLTGFTPTDAPPWLAQAFETGKTLEPMIRNMVQDRLETEVFGDQDTVDLYVDNNIVVRGHTDGFVDLSGKNGIHVVEIKALGKSLVEAHEKGKLFHRMPSYAWQASIYMYAAGQVNGLEYCPMIYAVYDKTKEELMELEWFIEPPIPIEDIQAKARKVVMYAKLADLPTECDVTGGFCPVEYLHDDDIEVVRDALFEAMLAEYDEIRDEEKQLKDRKAQLKRQIEQKLTSLGVKKANTDDFKVTTVTQTKTRLDTKAMEADGIDLDKYQKSYSYSYPKITPIK